MKCGIFMKRHHFEFLSVGLDRTLYPMTRVTYFETEYSGVKLQQVQSVRCHVRKSV